MGTSLTTLLSTGILKDVVGKDGPLARAADKTTKALTESVLADATINTIHGAFVHLNTGLNIILGVVVIMILISSFFIVYHSKVEVSLPQLTNNIVTLTLAIAVTISLFMLKLIFSTLDSTLFEDDTGVLVVAKRILNE